MDNDVSKADATSYMVVARRYRPREFGELIGQDHVAQALGKAIATGRVGHAYLFTGARGVGKTSTARIFAKALNIQSDTPTDLADDIAHAIDAGDDMDVIEIDGASNRGIEEIRQLRANVNVRPSRARYKIYIIDEVHMLTNQAFNALLKTLEEPPAHVKFIFCTTDPDKIPITVLSRCQRFDFAPVKFEAIRLRLQEICLAEGFAADEEALGLLARRAAGSMRDSQSLLEQVMSFSSDRITVEQVHALLGTADEGRLLGLSEALSTGDALQALELSELAIQAGADPGQLAEQLLNYLRDVMAVGVGGGPDLLKIANPMGHKQLQDLAQGWGVQTILSAIQILDESLVRMRSSVSAGTLLEVALVQICQLETLSSIPALLEAVMAASGGNRPPRAVSTAEKKNIARDERPPATASIPNDFGASPEPPSPEPPSTSTPQAVAENSSAAKAAAKPEVASSARNSPPAPVAARTAVVSGAPTSGPPKQPTASGAEASPAASSVESQAAGQPGSAIHSSSEALATWKRAVASIDGMLADFAAMAQAVQPEGSDHWKILFPPGAHRPSQYCDVAERRSVLQNSLQHALGRTIRLTFAVMPGEVPKPIAATPQATVRVQKMREIAEHPYVKKLCEALEGEILRVDPPRNTPPQATKSSSAAISPNEIS